MNPESILQFLVDALNSPMPESLKSQAQLAFSRIDENPSVAPAYEGLVKAIRERMNQPEGHVIFINADNLKDFQANPEVFIKNALPKAFDKKPDDTLKSKLEDAVEASTPLSTKYPSLPVMRLMNADVMEPLVVLQLKDVEVLAADVFAIPSLPILAERIAGEFIERAEYSTAAEKTVVYLKDGYQIGETTKNEILIESQTLKYQWEAIRN